MELRKKAIYLLSEGGGLLVKRDKDKIREYQKKYRKEHKAI